jgi:hypothetical protein
VAAIAVAARTISPKLMRCISLLKPSKMMFQTVC